MTEAPFAGPLAEVLRARLGAENSVAAPLSAERLRPLLLPADIALPLAPASDRSVWDRSSGSADLPAASAIFDRASSERGTSWPQPLAHDAARVHRDGDRDTFEQAIFTRQHRLSRAVVAAALTLEDGWIDEVVDGLWLICEQSSWCWPAHDDTFTDHGSVLATVTAPYLDLGAGEVVALLSWIDQLLGAQLDERYPGVRDRIRHEARVRVFDPFLTRRDWHWIGLDGDVHNWNPWIHSNIVTAALRLLDAPTEAALRAEVIAISVEGLDRYVASLPADGAIDEGYSYWWNGACRALEGLELLRHATGGALDAVADIPALRETVAFPHRMHLGGAWYLNLADGQARPSQDQPWHALYRAALAVGDEEAAVHAAAHRTAPTTAPERSGLGRLLLSLTDPSWKAATSTGSPFPRDVWQPSTEVLLARTAAGSTRGLTLAVKGGHNGEHHNHNDVGSFVVASDGVPVLVDAGRPTYTAQTFGPDRYSIWTMQSGWHNAPVVAGREQPAGAEFRARDVTATIEDAGSELSMELASAYDATDPESTLRSWRRTARLDRDAGLVQIDDEWTVDGDGVGAALHLIVAGSVELRDDGALVHPIDGAAPVRLRWAASVPAVAEVRQLTDPMLTEVWGDRLTRIVLDVAAVSATTVTVERVSTGEDHR